MLLQIFTIYDTKAGAYLPPFYLPQKGQALRTFGDCINDPKHQFSLHPGDYTLMSIGTWDDKTACAISNPPESIGNGLEFIVENEQSDLFSGKQKTFDDLSKEEKDAELKGFAKDHGLNPADYGSKKTNSSKGKKA